IGGGETALQVPTRGAMERNETAQGAHFGVALCQLPGGARFLRDIQHTKYRGDQRENALAAVVVGLAETNVGSVNRRQLSAPRDVSTEEVRWPDAVRDLLED